MEILSYLGQNQTAVIFSCFIISFTLFLYWVFIRPFYFFERLGIPHPKYRLLVGNFLEIRKGGTHRLIMKSMRKFGTVFGFYIGVKPIAVVADPTLLETVFVKQFSNFHNRFVAGSPKPPMHLNLLSAEYEYWKRIRSTLSPTFSSGKIRQMVPLVVQSIDTLVNIVSKFAKTGETFDIYKLYGRMTLEVILSVAFGLHTDFQLKGDKTVSREAAKYFVAKPKLLFVEMLPVPQFVKKLWKRMFATDPAYMLNLLKPVVAERKKDPSVRKDFLQLLLSENKSDGALKLSDEEIYASAITFLLAGYETTSNALAFTTYLLALHPEIQEKLHNEVKDFPVDVEDETIYDRLLKLGYLDCVINESLRMFPPGWRSTRQTENDIMLGKYKIPAGTGILIPIFAIHHFEKFWKDHDKFDPERFSPERKKDIIPFTFLPFGHGPRNCIGMRFALIEAKLTLVKLLKKFRFVKTDETEPYPPNLEYGVTLSPTNGIKIRIAER